MKKFKVNYQTGETMHSVIICNANNCIEARAYFYSFSRNENKHIIEVIETTAKAKPSQTVYTIPDGFNFKAEALRRYLEATEGESLSLEEIEAGETTNEDGEFSTEYGDYLVLTEDEADDRAKADASNSLWAFNAHFILEHTEFYNHSTVDEDDTFCKALEELQSRLCESATPIIQALAIDIDELIADAIDSDGRGHYISYYDGNETEINGLYIYRID